jgi:hypothetical protein
MQKWEPLRLVTLAAGVVDEPLPAAARLARRTLSVVTATSNEERVPETPPLSPSGGVLVLANDMPQARPPR